jgi:hypothetical protein
MYHTTRAGDRLPIAMMTDEHLLNTINVHLQRVTSAKHILRTEHSEVTSLFMGREAHQISKSMRQQAQAELMRFHERISPYVTEAVVRNLQLNNLMLQLQQALERTKAIPNPKPLKQIAPMQQTDLAAREPQVVAAPCKLAELEELVSYPD